MVSLYEGLAGYYLKYWGGVCGIGQGKNSQQKKVAT